MPVLDKSTNGLPAGTRYATARMDVPRDAVKSVGGRTRALTYAYNAVDRAAKNWFDEFKEIPDWEHLRITIVFATFEVNVEIADV